LYARIQIDPESGFGPKEAEELANEALARRSISFRLI
jgi:hypothetical protein